MQVVSFLGHGLMGRPSVSRMTMPENFQLFPNRNMEAEGSEFGKS